MSSVALPPWTYAPWVTSDGPLRPAQTARVGLALVEALREAHQAGIVHRDVKPGNVLLRRDGRVVLTDFGIARFTGDPTLTSTGLLLGSPSYIAPERARGGKPVPASDVWSLGATLYTAVEGRPPFDAGDPLGTLSAVATQPQHGTLALNAAGGGNRTFTVNQPATLPATDQFDLRITSTIVDNTLPGGAASNVAGPCHVTFT